MINEKLKVKCDSNGIDIAVKTIQRGGTIVFPTDTVYGIGCDPFREDSIKTIYKIKKRIESKPLPVLGYSKKELSKIAIFDEKSNKIAEKFWPGKITLVLTLKDEKIKKSLNLDDKIAVRVPNNKCALSILSKCKLLVGTSANFSGTQPFIDPKECMKKFSGFDVFVDGGYIHEGKESTVVTIDDEIKILRQGKISKEEILEIF